MSLTRKPSQPRAVRFISRFAPLPDSATPELKEWWEAVQAAISDDHQTTEDAFAKLRKDLANADGSAAIAALAERIAALEARPVGTSRTTNTTIVENIAANDLTQAQKDALAGSFGEPAANNPYVTNNDPRLVAKNVPIGAVIDFVGTTAPKGWLLCDGSAVARTGSYAGLFAVIGTTYGPGDGSTTFNLPDCRGRSPMGAGTGAGLTARTLGQQLGAESVTLTGAQSGLPAHHHTVPWRDNSCASGSDNDTGTMTSGPITTVDTSDAGPQDAAEPHPNVHPVIVFNRIIKF